MVFKSGQMEQSMKDTGKTTKQTVKESFSIRMVIFLKDNGNETWCMDMVSTTTSLGHSTKDSGSMTCNMVSEMKYGQITLNTLGFIIKVRNRGKASINGKTVLNIMATGLRIRFMDKGDTCGQMAESMKVAGTKALWMVWVYINGLMEEYLKAIM